MNNDTPTELSKALELHKSSKLDQAEVEYKKLLQKNPQDFMALQLLGALLAQKGDRKNAIKLLKLALEIDQTYFQVFFNLANILHKEKSYEECCIYYKNAINLNSKNVEAHNGLADSLMKLKRYEEALGHYHAAINLNSKFTKAYSGICSALEKLERVNDALVFSACLIALMPKNPGTYNNHGSLLFKLSKLESAVSYFTAALKLDPNFPDALNNRGMAYNSLKLWDLALQDLNRAIQYRPNFSEAWNNKGNVLQKLQQYPSAIQAYKTAISFNEKYFGAHNNLGNAYKEMGEIELAIDHYKKSIKINPDSPDAYLFLGLCDLLNGNYEEGWAGYEYRWKSANSSKTAGKRTFSKPTWDGTPPKSKTKILIYGEQGLGDTIQFCRYLPLLKRFNFHTIFEVPQPLMHTLRTLPGVDEFIIKGQKYPDFDVQFPLLSLPHAFNTTIDTIPKIPDTFKIGTNKIHKWQRILGEKRKFRIGIACSGNPNFISDTKRSIPLEIFMRGLPTENVEIVFLQKELRPEDRLALNSSDIQFYGDLIHDFSDTAALASLMDVVVSTCTSIPHFTATLGIPTWILLSYVADWRWLRNISSSPWYPSVKLYRQTSLGNWDDIMCQLKHDLFIKINV